MQSSAQPGPSELEQMQEKASEGLREARVAIESFARKNPRTAIGVALGVGFVLGGGLTPRVLLGLGVFAARALARDYAKKELSGMTRNIFGTDEEEAASAPAKKA